MENSQEYREQGRQGKQRNSEWVGDLTKMQRVYSERVRSCENAF